MAFAEDSGDEGVRRRRKEPTPPPAGLLSGKRNVSRSSLAAIQEHPPAAARPGFNRDVTPPPSAQSEHALRRLSASAGKSPGSSRRNFTGVFSDMLHRSSSSRKTDQSPSNFVGSSRVVPSAFPFQPQRKLHRHSSSASDIPPYSTPSVLPAVTTSASSSSFFSRAKVLSKSSWEKFGNAPSVPSPPLSPTTSATSDILTPRPSVKRTNSLGRAARALVGVPRPISIVSYISESATIRATSPGGPNAAPTNQSTVTTSTRVPDQKRRQMQHAPSLSLDMKPGTARSIPSPTNQSRPQTAIPFGQVDDETVERELNRRHSHTPSAANGGELRIPKHITSKSVRLEEDLANLAAYQTGVRDLIYLRGLYDELIADQLASTTGVTGSLAKGKRSLQMLQKLDYDKWFEEAEVLIELGDGNKASHRERTTSLLPDPDEPVGVSDRQAQNHSTVDLNQEGGKERKRDILENILSPRKGSDMEATSRPCTPTNPRPFPLQAKPSLSTISSVPSPSRVGDSPSRSKLRRVSRAGIFGIQQFLKTLKLRANEENESFPETYGREDSLHAPYLSDPSCQPRKSLSNPPSTPRGSHSDVDLGEEWDIVGTRTGASITTSQRHRTQSSQTISRSQQPKGKFNINTSHLPGLTNRVFEVRNMCQIIINELQTKKDQQAIQP
ncbi:hypothetical protein BT69DRAFT_945039 [Atractiella rhizophila]|nr:hypothetical protein BT69DRAFT_945039 [Atractiella rhizophila]